MSSVSHISKYIISTYSSSSSSCRLALPRRFLFLVASFYLLNSSSRYPTYESHRSPTLAYYFNVTHCLRLNSGRPGAGWREGGGRCQAPEGASRGQRFPANLRPRAGGRRPVTVSKLLFICLVCYITTPNCTTFSVLRMYNNYCDVDRLKCVYFSVGFCF